MARAENLAGRRHGLASCFLIEAAVLCVLDQLTEWPELIDKSSRMVTSYGSIRAWGHRLISNDSCLMHAVLLDENTKQDEIVNWLWLMTIVRLMQH